MKPEIEIFTDKLALAKTMKEDLMETFQTDVSTSPDYFLALAGGSTPRIVYEQWATIQDDSLWMKMHFFWGDERCVPPDHDESNYKMAYDAFLSKIPVRKNRIHPIHGEENPDIEVQRYSEEIRNHVAPRSRLPQFDWILLGVGDDGHTASLFPNSPALNEKDSICVIARHPQSGQTRISLTLPIINNAKKITFLVTGKEKAAIIREILKDKSSNYPAARVKPGSGILQWYLDEEAAGEL